MISQALCNIQMKCLNTILLFASPAYYSDTIVQFAQDRMPFVIPLRSSIYLVHNRS